MIAYLNNIGIAKTKINNSIDAIDHYFKCIQCKESLYEKNHKSTINTL